MAFGICLEKNIFASKINLTFVTSDVSEMNFMMRFLDFIRNTFDASFGGPCSKKRIFSPNEELDGSKFGKLK